jgi:flavin-binding protein dodecin
LRSSGKQRGRRQRIIAQRSIPAQSTSPITHHDKEESMAKKRAAADAVYKVVEVIGTSTESWEDAARNAVETAAETLRDLRIAEVVKTDMKVENGKVVAFRTRVLVSFKYES